MKDKRIKNIKTDNVEKILDRDFGYDSEPRVYESVMGLMWAELENRKARINIYPFLSAAAVLIVLIAGAVFWTIAALNPASGGTFIITSLTGNVRLDHGNKICNTASGGRIGRGDILETMGAGSCCEFKLEGAGVYRLSGPSEIKVNKLLYSKNKLNAEIALSDGIILLKSRKLQEGESFAVKTRFVKASIAGTVFSVESISNQITGISVLEGKVPTVMPPAVSLLLMLPQVKKLL